MTRERVALAAAVVFALAVGVRLYVGFGDVGFVGWDTYPMLEASRVRSPSDLGEIFGTSMLGKNEGGIYYRPLPKLTLALDEALFGLDPRGYQATSALLVAASGLAVAASTASLLGAGAWLGPCTALAFYALHPIHAVVVPVPARRADVLCILFAALAVAVQARAARKGRPLSLAAAALGGLALLSKETAFALVPANAVVAFLYFPDRSRALRSAAVAAAPHVLVALAALALRATVIGDVVGDRPVLQEGIAGATWRTLGLLAGWALAPDAVIGRRALPWGSLLLAGVGVGAALLLARPRRPAAARFARAGLVVLAWIVPAAAVYGWGLVFQPWYALVTVAALAMGVGAIAELGVGWIRSAPTPARVAAAVGLAGIAGLTLQLGRRSPLLHDYEDWRAASALAESYLHELHREVEAARPGAQIRFPSVPRLLPRVRGRPKLRGVAVLAEYSVVSWAHLVLPNTGVRVEVAGVGAPEPAADEVVVILGAPAAAPFPPETGTPTQGR